jgi:hypothetical protein
VQEIFKIKEWGKSDIDFIYKKEDFQKSVHDKYGKSFLILKEFYLM